jgi:Sulfotransferase family
MKTPFAFLMCSERCGSNFTARLFDAHPELCGPSPVHLLRLVGDHAGRWGDLREDRWWELFTGDVAQLLDTKVGHWRTSSSAARLRHLSERTAGAVLRHVWLTEAHANGKRGLFLKENHLWRYLPFVFSAFPGAKIVVQVRDPRDMALSWRQRDELRGDVVRAAETWKEDQSQALAILGVLRLEGRAAVVRYEDLVDAPERELTRLCAFLGVSYAPEMLRFHEDEITRENAHATGAWENLAKPVMTGNHGKWRTGLSPDEVRFVEWTCGSQMTAFGYARTVEAAAEGELDALRASLASQERQEKPGYAKLPEDEREKRAARAAVLDELKARPVLGAV